MDRNDSSVSHVGADDADLQPGQEVGEYVVDRKVGEGGFGTVFQATHPIIGKQVAIKVLSRQYSANEEMVSRFVAEARSVNQIRHRHIIDIFSFGQLEDGRHYYVMEFLEGQPLDQFIRQSGALSLPEAIPILRDVARALAAAHEHNIVHRDLKPENVFLAQDHDGTLFPKLLDFGIAKLLANQGQEHKTRTGAPIGTPAYMSPEQCRGKDVDHRTDIYAFGILAYELLAGVVPFFGEDYMEIILKQLQEEPTPPSTHMPALPAAVDRCILSMLAKTPSERPQTLMAAIGELEAAAVEAGVQLPPAVAPTGIYSVSAARAGAPTPGAHTTGSGAISGAATVDASGAAATASGYDAPMPAKRRLVGVIAALAAAVVLAMGVLVVVGGGNDQAPATGELDQSKAVKPASPDTPSPQDSAAAPGAPTTPAAPVSGAPTVSTITVEGAPEGTEVYGPNGPVGVAPGQIALPRGDQPITLTFRAEGYRLASQQVVPNSDQTLTVELEAKRSKRRPRRKNDNKKKRQRDRDKIEDPFAN